MGQANAPMALCWLSCLSSTLARFAGTGWERHQPDIPARVEPHATLSLSAKLVNLATKFPTNSQCASTPFGTSIHGHAAKL